MIETLGLYKILDPIGTSGMGEVYRARDTRLGRTVAITVISQDIAGHPDRRERFVRDARAAATLSHPNIATVYEVGEDEGRLFLVCEFVPGEALRTATGGRPMNSRRAIDLAVQIGDALADAHAVGIVHRDIKPDSIIVTSKGNAKILHCGLAAWTGGDAERDRVAGVARTATTTESSVASVLNTVAYMSPEQALGEQVDHHTDIFSLGIVLFEMLTGTLPFTGTTSAALALQIVQAPAPTPSSVRTSLPRELDAIVGKAITKSLDQRYEAAATFAAELRTVGAILDVRTEASEPADTLVALQRPQRSYAGWIVGTLVLAAIGVVAWAGRDALQAWLSAW